MVQRQGDDVYIAQGIFAFRVVQQGALKWENMFNAEDKKLDLEVIADVATEETVANIPADMITEIAGVINAITRDPSAIQIFFPEE